jgi:hypothetical protein
MADKTMMMMMGGRAVTKKNSRNDVLEFTLLHANLYDFNFIIRYSRVARRD